MASLLNIIINEIKSNGDKINTGKKVISAVVAICVMIGLVIAFWKSVFSVKSEHDVRFF